MQKMSTGMKFAFFLSSVALLYLFAVSFAPMTKDGAEQAKNISPFMLATILATVVNFYFGKKHENQTPTYLSALEEKAKEEAAKLENARIEEARKEAARIEAERIEVAKEDAAKVIEAAKTEVK